LYSVIGFTAVGCRSYDTVSVIRVYPLPNISFDRNPELCIGTTRTLDPGAFSSYLWQDGSVNRTLTVNNTGNYSVQVIDNNGCLGEDSVHITTVLPLPQDFLPPDTAICSYGTLTLKPLKTFAHYNWSTGSNATTITLDKSGQYSLEVQDSKGCVGRDTVLVNSKDCMKGVYVPTAFTPNGDGKNDLFKALVFGPVKDFKLTVYNRWGEIVFECSDPNKGWDGKIKGAELDTGVYVWLCRYSFEGAEKVEKGTVTLVH
jgi:gliding motility-associated-like protein